jgi:hypothetical protein
MINRSDPPQKPDLQRRLSAALRENLKRRKAQAKGRQEERQATAAQRDQNSHDSAGIPNDKRPSESG